MRRIILSGTQAREELAKGGKFLADATRSTLGPFGQNAFLDKHNKVTNDGITIAREIQLSDEVQNRGALAIREAGIKTDEEAGDGTTTAITLAYEIYEAVSSLLPEEGVVGKKSPSEILKQVETEKNEIIEKLKAQSTPIETKEQLINSARVAVEDKELGELIGTMQWDLGKDGRIVVEPSNDKKCSAERTKGIRIDNGFGTSQLINNQEKQILEVAETRILLTSWTIKTLADWKEIMRIYDVLVKNGGRNLVVIARAWTDETVAWCLKNVNAGAPIYPISAPYTDMQEKMKDIKAVVGGEFYDSESSQLKDIQFIGLGSAYKITANRNEATIVGDDNELTQVRVQSRVQELKEKLKGSESEFEKKMLEERIAQLENGFALLKVSATSDMERERIYDKCVDAVNAVRAAFQEGTVKGAGLAYKEISDNLPDSYILKRPLLSIYQQIMSTAPKDFVIEDWVRDPVKVLRVALERACATAKSFATAGIVITEELPKPAWAIVDDLKIFLSDLVTRLKG